MIPFDFEYYRPSSVKEAVGLYRELKGMGKHPVYFSGGTEIITLGRLNHLYTDAVIDIKHIPECQSLQFDKEHFVIGAAKTLSKIENTRYFPLLNQNVKEIADHTTRYKVTLGGNICGNIFYREAVLPFLITDSEAMIANSEGLRFVPINEIFNEKLLLADGEFLVQLRTKKELLNVNHISIKKRKQWETGYPLITVSAIQINERIQLAISGLCPFPFRSEAMEACINMDETSAEKRVHLSLEQAPRPVLHDTEGSAQYRMFVLKNTLMDVVTKLEGGTV